MSHFLSSLALPISYPLCHPFPLSAEQRHVAGESLCACDIPLLYSPPLTPRSPHLHSNLHRASCLCWNSECHYLCTEADTSRSLSAWTRVTEGVGGALSRGVAWPAWIRAGTVVWIRMWIVHDDLVIWRARVMGDWQSAWMSLRMTGGREAGQWWVSEIGRSLMNAQRRIFIHVDV